MTETTNSHPSLDQAISPEAAARQLGCSVGTLAKWRSTGKHKLPYLKYGTGARAAIRYRQRDITEFIQRSLVEA